MCLLTIKESCAKQAEQYNLTQDKISYLVVLEHSWDSWCILSPHQDSKVSEKFHKFLLEKLLTLIVDVDISNKNWSWWSRSSQDKNYIWRTWSLVSTCPRCWCQLSSQSTESCRSSCAQVGSPKASWHNSLFMEVQFVKKHKYQPCVVLGSFNRLLVLLRRFCPIDIKFNLNQEQSPK